VGFASAKSSSGVNSEIVTGLCYKDIVVLLGNWLRNSYKIKVLVSVCPLLSGVPVTHNRVMSSDMS